MTDIIDIRARLSASVAERQSSVEPQPGEIYTRGGRLLVVESRDGDSVRWRYDDGTGESGTLADFRGLALERIDVKPPPGADADYISHAWAIAATREIPGSLRAAQLRETLKRAPSQDDRSVVLRWIGQLVQGAEPLKKG